MSPELYRPSFCTFSPQHFIHSIQFVLLLFENCKVFQAADKSFKVFTLELQCCRNANKKQKVCFVFVCLFCIFICMYVFVMTKLQHLPFCQCHFETHLVFKAPDKSLNSLPENCKVAKVQTRRSWAFAVASCYD